jgi:multidrug resistance efflux pump
MYEKSVVKTILSEQVENVFKKEGDVVKAGDILLTLSTEKLKVKEIGIQQNIELKQEYIADLNKMLEFKASEFPKTDLFLKEYNDFSTRENELNNKVEKTKKEYERNSLLYKNNIISEKEFDDFKYQYTVAQNDKKVFISAKQSGWQALKSSYESDIEKDKNELKALSKEKQLYNIKAPIDGTIEELKGIFPGTNVESGQAIAIISPDSGMMAEVFVTPRDIGFVKKEYPVRIQVDAFNYNEWGMVNGKIKDISDDYVLINNAPCFRIRCSLSSDELSLKSGIKGKLKKGMTIRARFVITEKTILQLIYENIDNLLNPTQKKT